MNKTIIENINSRVQANDILYFLGDFAFGDKSKIPIYRESINCNDIRFIYGNHDHVIKDKYQHLFTWCRDYYEFFHGKTLITLFHYPIGSWNGIGRGAINCFAHCHGNYKNSVGRQIDVGVDAQNFFPISLDEVMDRMLKINPTYVDHHDSNTNIY